MKKNERAGKNKPAQSDAARKSKQRAANRDWLRRMGWTGDAETLITAARRGRVRLTFEIVKKGNENG